MGPDMRVACLGECMVELSEHGDGRLTRSFGGDTLNTAVYLARLGAPTEYVTALGTDPLSDGMAASWQAEGVGTGAVLRVAGALPGLYMIQTDPAGERQFFHWRDSAPVRRLFQLPDAAVAEDALCRAGLVYLSGITLSLFVGADRERLFAVLARARRAGARVAFDTNFRARGWPDLQAARDAFERAFRASDVVLAGVEDHAPVFGSADPEAVMARLREAGVAEAVVKHAVPACQVRCGDTDALVPAPPVAGVVDTTAAGDSFAAAYLSARLGGRGPVAAAQAGHRLAGVVVRHRGAIIPRDAMPPLVQDTP